MKLILAADDGATLAEVTLGERDQNSPFSTGSIGYFASAKVEIPSVSGQGIARHQVSASVVEIGTKGLYPGPGRARR